MQLSDQEIQDRALRRYESDCKKEGAIFQQPSDITYHAKASVVVLSNVRGELARYYVTNNGLRAIDELEETPSNPQRTLRRTLAHFAGV